MAFKKNQIALRQATFGVTPDEMDRYEVYTVNNPATALLGPLFFASAGTAGTASSIALVVNNKYPDFPRNIQFSLAGTGVGMAGTATVNGQDQFGSAITESFGFGSADNGGTVAGTRVFGQIISGTLNYGTAIGNGTPGFAGVPGTACLFGLPVKIQSVTDVVRYGMSAGTGPISVGGGTNIGSLINAGTGPVPGVHAFRPFAAFGGTTFFNVWIKSTYNGENESVMAAGTQAS